MALKPSRIVAVSSVLLFLGLMSCQAPEIRPPHPSAPSVSLPNGWTEEERQQWYHLSPGTQLLPYDWFLALAEEPFKNNFPRFGVLPDPYHPDHLPVGLTKTTGPEISTPQLGITCAFCHTSEFSFQGKTFRIEGGPSLQYNARFVQALVEALGELQDPSKFDTFVSRLRSQERASPPAPTREELATQLRMFLVGLIHRSGRDTSPALWGPGRFDALGRGGNLVFSPLSSDNIRPANAPVSIPPLWGAWRYDWVQWSGSIEHPLGRNIAQVIGVNANLFVRPTNPLIPFVDPEDPFRSSVDIQNLRTLESLVRKLKPPRWPAEFPSIDRAQAARGRDLYHGNPAKQIPNLCAHCHIAGPLPSPLPSGQHLKVTMIPQKEVGTDALYLENFGRRRVDTGAFGKTILPAHKASELIINEIMARAGVAGDPEYAGITNEWLAESHYIARPHVSVWATAPYLHNGSVPNLYELLSPIKERHTCFFLSPTMEYDPTKVGFVVQECTGNPGLRDPLSGFELKTALPANGNAGHQFANTAGCAAEHKEPGVLGCEIPPEDRFALLEYLKTCDLEDVEWKQTNPCRDLEGPNR